MKHTRDEKEEFFPPSQNISGKKRAREGGGGHKHTVFTQKIRHMHTQLKDMHNSFFLFSSPPRVVLCRRYQIEKGVFFSLLFCPLAAEKSVFSTQFLVPFSRCSRGKKTKDPYLVFSVLVLVSFHPVDDDEDDVFSFSFLVTKDDR